MLAIGIRDERAEDEAAVAALNRAAFGGEEEAAIVARLRRDRLIAVALVATVQSKIIGHIVLSWLPAEMDSRTLRALALAPMAVAPEYQRRGIGSRLVEAAIAAAKETGAEAIIVVGHPRFYPRFGFSAELARKLDSPFPGDAFMALELNPDALAGERGAVFYPAAFGLGEAGNSAG